MTTIEPIQPTWRDRDVPLEAAAVVARGSAARALATSTAARVRGGARLGAAAGHDFFVVVGEADHLPWSDGAVYLGWESGVLVPTTREPIPRTALIADVARQGARPDDLVIVLPELVLHTNNPPRITDPALLLDDIEDR